MVSQQAQPQVISIHAPTPAARQLWSKALELAEIFGEGRWTLIGGLMVQLHGFERGSGSRLTEDIDLLGDSRRPPRMTERIAETLVERGGEMATPSTSDEDLGYKFTIDGETVEVLGPDGLKREPRTIGKHVTFQVPGGSQALRRTETVLVSLDDQPPVGVRRPSLLGAILIKARVVVKERPEKFGSDRQDLIRLLTFVDDPRALAEAGEISKSERGWLRDTEQLLEFDDPALAEVFSSAEVTGAEQSFRLLIG